MNVGRGDLVCAVKNQGVPVHHHCPDQGAVGQGKNHRKKLLIVWNPDKTVPQNIGIVAEVQQEILPFVFPIHDDSYENQDGGTDSIVVW